MAARTSTIVTAASILRQEGRKKALKANLTEFNAPCALHGEFAMFDTMTGACLLCLDKYSDLPAIAQFKAAMGVFYPARCDPHGTAPFYLTRLVCSKCFDWRGRERRPPSARAMAMRAGSTFYADVCARHGPTDFRAATGQCAACFTAGKLVRDRPKREFDPVRIQARRSGAASYVAHCETHGDVPHHTIRGKCLRCFNTLGQPRKGPPVTVY